MYKVKPPTDWANKCYIQWIKDINSTIGIFFRIVYEDYNLYDLMLGDMLTRIIDSFQDFNSLVLDRKEIDKIFSDKDLDIYGLRSKLVTWLNVEYHPKTLYSDLSKTIEIFKYEKQIKKYKIYDRLSGWLYYSKQLKEYLNLRRLDTIKNKIEFEFDNEQLILRYYDFIGHFITQLGIKF